VSDLPQRTLSGAPVRGEWESPRVRTHAGRLVTLEPVDPGLHARELFEASHDVPGAETLWDYMPYGPFADVEALGAWLAECQRSSDPLFFAFRLHQDDLVAGMGSMMRLTPAHGVGELGHIWLGPRLQRHPAATEALYLMMRHLLGDLGYRRLEWKCNALNDASRRAALRLGFRFEGIFFQHLIVKGHNRDTAWFSLLDQEWPAVQRAFERWLEPSNFAPDGMQQVALSALTAR
jgi:RimJ/RimL family protein N-acetyltransferase